MKLLLLAVLSGFVIGIQSDAAMPLTGIVRNIRGGGAPIPAATVIVTNNRTGVRTEVKTAADGTFVVPGAQPGTYRIVIGAAGFQPLVTYDFCVVPGKPPVFSAGLGPDRGNSLTIEQLEKVSPQRRSPSLGPPSAPEAGSLTSALIDDALALGARSASVAPYELKDGRRVVAKIFTPTWRVTAMGRRAAAAQRPVTVVDIPKPLVQDLIWVVADPDEARRGFFAIAEEVLVAVDGNPADEVQAVWTMAIASECDLEAMEWLFDRHFVRGSTIAAFRPADLRVGNKLVIVYSPFAQPRSGRSIKVHPKELRIPLTEAVVNAWK